MQTIEDYSHVWVEEVDRGGLYKVNDNIFKGNGACVQEALGCPVEPRIKEDILNICSSSWRRICSNTDSSMLLEYIGLTFVYIRLLNIGQTEFRQRKLLLPAIPSLRKTLKHIGSEKDSTR